MLTDRVSVKRLPADERPRERLLWAGREALSDVELVSLVIGGGIVAASGLVTDFGGASGLGRALVGELRARPGIGVARACQLVAAAELGLRAARGASIGAARMLSTPAQVAAQLADLARLEQEELHVLALDTRHRIVTRFIAARGSLNVVHIAPREVFRRLVREGAAAAIVVHNHPAGDPTPSAEDFDLTQRLRAAGDLVGVPLLDHVIIGGAGFFSFADDLRAERAPIR